MSRRFHHITIAAAVALFAAMAFMLVDDAIANLRADLRMIERMDAGR